MKEPSFQRPDGRAPDELRPVIMLQNFAPAAAGSVLMGMGDTRVICAVSLEERVPPWMRQQKVEGGWLTAEYSMLPYATADRSRREASAGKLSGRTQEIQRLIGRALRAVIDLKALGSRTVYLDCDVLQADGGTRTASITGAYAALRLAVQRWLNEGRLEEDPCRDSLAAVSVGMVSGEVLLDLCYEEDRDAEVDMNVVMTGSGRFVEIQGTAESKPFTRSQQKALLAMADQGIQELHTLRVKTIGS